MKSMRCIDLGGACDKIFSAETFEEIAKLSQKHGMEMFKIGDHLQAMDKMKSLMENKEDMVKWMDQKKKEFDSLPED